MTLKGITRTCYGSMFNDEEEVHRMSHIYQKVINKLGWILEQIAELYVATVQINLL